MTTHTAADRTLDPDRQAIVPAAQLRSRHLLGIEGLTSDEITR
jgi:hypothetical protein